MNQRTVISDLKKAVIKNYYSKLTVPGHDWDHVERVYKLAQKILKTEPNANKFVVRVAVLLHDIGRLNEERGSKTPHAKDSVTEGEKLLKKYRIDPKKEHLILQAVGQHSDFASPSTLEGRILQDADKLDCLGAIGIARSLCHWSLIGKKMFDPKNPFGLEKGQTLSQKIRLSQVGFQKTLDERAKKFMFECFLRFNNNFITMFHTKQGLRLAKRKHSFLKEFLMQLQKDITL